jgi:superfamily II DNA or RNA helicase
MAIEQDTLVRIRNRPELGTGQVVRVITEGDRKQADVVFERNGQRILETFPVDALEVQEDIFAKYAAGKSSRVVDFALKQLAYQFPLDNLGGTLSNSKTDLLPHQILLTHQVVKAHRRRFLIADEVGLGKTIETGMVIRELAARDEGGRILIVCPAGLTENWQRELRDCFRMHFERLGYDFFDSGTIAWETHNKVIASIDTIKQTRRLERILSGPKWDCIVFDEAHHLSRKRYGRKITATQNFRLADKLKDYTRDLLFLSATPHQGNAYQFWSLIQLLDDQLFEGPEAMQDHRGLLNRVMFRRTKREATDAEGNPIFMRRKVHTQLFQLSLREQRFYEKVTAYLKAGYSAAGLGSSRTTAQQRAVGFVMATFQKMMSSSPRAIKQSLRRRLLALYARKQLGLESGEVGRITDSKIATKITWYQEQMRKLATAILSYERGPIDMVEADAHIIKVKQRLTKRTNYSEEITSWALDAMEDSDAAIEAEANIPDEEQKLQELIDLVEEAPDRKLHTLVRAIEQLRRENPQEKIIVFTQYRETLFFIKDELAKYYGEAAVSILKGGPLDDKIAACESFWKEDGTQFLISTTAGGEGINLQVARILFNYDLPWNPMAVEQRIGRIHRYGQTETAQVYSLVAEDTIEEKVYNILERKLWEIANTIGKIDTETGEVTEDFRSEVLGYLSSAVNYNDLYREALVNRDYQRTEREIEDALRQAKKASDALRELTQDLTTFNLEQYAKLKGRYTLDDLKLFTQKAVISLGGSFVPSGDIIRIVTPQILLDYPRVSARYDNVTFSRKTATRKKGIELLGLGHPLIDAVVSYYKSEKINGYILLLEDLGRSFVSIRYIFEIDFADGMKRTIYKEVLLQGNRAESDLDLLKGQYAESECTSSTPIERDRLESIIENIKASIRSEYDGIISIRHRCVGIAAANLAS